MKYIPSMTFAEKFKRDQEKKRRVAETLKKKKETQTTAPVKNGN